MRLSLFLIIVTFFGSDFWVIFEVIFKEHCNELIKWCENEEIKWQWRHIADIQIHHVHSTLQHLSEFLSQRERYSRNDEPREEILHPIEQDYHRNGHGNVTLQHIHHLVRIHWQRCSSIFFRNRSFTTRYEISLIIRFAQMVFASIEGVFFEQSAMFHEILASHKLVSATTKWQIN